MSHSIYFQGLETGPNEPSKMLITIVPPLGSLAAEGVRNEIAAPGDAPSGLAEMANITCDDKDKTSLVVTGANPAKVSDEYALARYVGRLIDTGGSSHASYLHVLASGGHHVVSGPTHDCTF